MKKLLCMLLSLSLLLGMSLSATAVTSGQLVDGDNEIELPWDTDEASVYTYTATQTGTLYIATVAFGYAEGSYDYEDNMEKLDDEWGWYTRLTVDGQLLEGLYFGTVEVVEGQTYTFSWSHGEDVVFEKWYDMGWNAVLNLSYSGELVPKLGSIDLPVELFMDQCPTESIEIAPGERAYYLLYDFGGATFTVTGENAYVVVEYFDMDQGKNVTIGYKAKDGVVTVPVENYYTTIQIGNAGKENAVFALDFFYPLGTRQNPAQLAQGENVAVTVAENYDGYYFTYTAPCDGTLTLTFPATGWMYSVVNMTSGGLDVFYTYDYEGAANPLVVEVKKGDVISINVNSFNGMMVPGGDVIFKANVSYNHSFVNGVCEHCGEEEVVNEPGDVNGDGRINARDARAILRYLAGLVDDSEIDTAAADFNGDGRINVRDARAILRHIAGT